MILIINIAVTKRYRTMKQKKNRKNRPLINPAEFSKCISLVQPMIEKIVMGLGFHLLEISFTSENQTNYLRLTVMHDEHPISTNDCEIISRNVGKELDSSNLIPFQYVLEIQSKGIDEDTVQNLEHEFVLEKIGLTVRS